MRGRKCIKEETEEGREEGKCIKEETEEGREEGKCIKEETDEGREEGGDRIRWIRERR